jgi:hypothetical protein
MVSRSAYERSDEAACGGAVEARCVVALGDAVAPWSTTVVAVSFAACANADVGRVHRSRKAVHLRSGAPIVGIAWAHCSIEPEVQASRSAVYGHHALRGQGECRGWFLVNRCLGRHVAASGRYTARALVPLVCSRTAPAKTSCPSTPRRVTALTSAQSTLTDMVGIINIVSLSTVVLQKCRTTGCHWSPHQAWKPRRDSTSQSRHPARYSFNYSHACCIVPRRFVKATYPCAANTP